MESVVERAARVADDVASRAGSIARAAFGSGVATTAKTSPLDVVTNVDHLAEALIIAGIRDHFPDHSVIAEESGSLMAAGPWTWLIDPLDGTNNFAIGLPLYGLSVVLLHEGRPVLAVVQDSHLDRRLCVTVEGAASASGSVDLAGRSAGAFSTVSLQQGYPIPRGDRRLMLIRHEMETTFHRVLYTWSPSIDLLLLATGALGGIVGFGCIGPEHVAARFVSERIGLHLRSDGNDALHRPSTYCIGRPETVDRLWRIVEDGLAATE